TILYVPLLAYGILQTHLFDIDMKIKLGISRGTVATLGIIGVIVAAKIAELYLSRTLGYIAGGVVAGTMVVYALRLLKVGDRVANAAMPKVQPTSEYLAFKKLEVYRAAVESALETGGITTKERASLDRLCGKLNLASPDAAAVEAELAPVAQASG